MREVSSAQSRALLGQALASAPFAGATIITHQSGGVNLGAGNTIGTMGDVVAGDKVGGDKVAGDKISVGDISGSSGIAIGRGARATVGAAPANDELAARFAEIYRQIAASDKHVAIKETVTKQVEEVAAEAAKGEQADASKIEGWLHIIGSMMPDILEVTANTLLSPISGIAIVVKKSRPEGQSRGRTELDREFDGGRSR